MPIPGTVQITGQLAPTALTDTYPTHDAIYGKGGQRSVADHTERDAIPNDRRTEGMVVYTASDFLSWQLNPPPWTGTASDWSPFNPAGSLAGDVTGPNGSNTVERIRGVNVDPTAPTSGAQLIYNGLTGSYEPTLPTRYFTSGALAQAAAPFINGTTVVIYPGSPTSEAGTYEVTINGGVAFPADYTKVSDLTDTASEVSIVDAGNYYPGAGNVENALQQIGAGTAGQISGALALGANIVDQVSATTQGAALWHLEVVNSTLRYASVVHGTHDGTTGYGVEENITLTPGIGVAPFTIDVDVSGGNLRLTITMTATGWSFRVRRQVLAS